MEKVTKFDLENAFKALNEINFEARKSLRENYKMAKQEAARVKTPTEALLEDYYDVGSESDLIKAKKEREDEIAKAKLAKIEKIVDLDADSPEDLEPSYAGKTIIQCPQCMTMFYKDPTDVNISEEDPEICNVGEKCQHCGNDSGYTLVGKVAPINSDEAENFEEAESEEGAEDSDVDLNAMPVESEEETTSDEQAEAAEEEVAEESDAEDAEDKNESFRPTDFSTMLQEAKEPEDELKGVDNAVVDCKVNKVIAHCEDEKPDCLGEKKPLEKPLTEDKGKVDDLAKKLKEHNEYIEYLQKQIELEEDNLRKSGENEFVKNCIQRKIDGYKKDLNDALPEQVKAEGAIEDLPTPEELKKESLTEDAKAELALKEFEKELEDGLDEELDANVLSAANDCIDELEAINDKYEKLVSEEESDEEIEENLKEASLEMPLTDPRELEAPAATNSEFGRMLRSPVFQAFGESLHEELDQSIVSAADDCVNELEAINDKYGKLASEDAAIEEPTEEEPIEEGLFDHAEKKAKEALRGSYKVYWVRLSPANGANVNVKAKDDEGNEIQDAEFKTFEEAEDYAIKASKGEKVGLIKKAASPYVAYIKCGIDEAKANGFDACQTLGLLYKNGKITERSEDKLNAIIAKAKKGISADASKSEEDSGVEKAVEAEKQPEEKQADKEISGVVQQEDPKILKAGAKNVKAENVDEGDLIMTDSGKVHEIKKDDPEIEKYRKSGKPAVRFATGKVKTTLAKLGLLENLDGVEEIDEDSFGLCIEKELKEVYSNVDSFKCENCEISDGKLIVEGMINFASGKSRKAQYAFDSACRQGDLIYLTGKNEGLCESNTVNVGAKFGAKLLAEDMGYRCVVEGNTIEGRVSLKE